MGKPECMLRSSEFIFAGPLGPAAFTTMLTGQPLPCPRFLRSCARIISLRELPFGGVAGFVDHRLVLASIPTSMTLSELIYVIHETDHIEIHTGGMPSYRKV